MQLPGDSRHGDQVKGIFDEIAVGPGRLDLSQGYNARGVVDAGGGAKQNRFLQFFRDLKSVCNQFFGFLDARWLHQRQP